MIIRRRISGGVLLVLVGAFFLLVNFNVIPWDFKKLWPVLLILLGLTEMLDFG